MVRRLGLIIMCILLGLPLGMADEPKPWQLDFQESVTPIMDRIHDLHLHLLYVIIPIGVFVTVLMLYVIWRFRASKNPKPSKTTHHTLLEVVWTAIPVMILLVIGIPSVKLVYFADKVQNADLTVKVVGNQWYWHYQYPDSQIEFDSRMIVENELKPGQRRLLEVDNQMVLPVDTNIRLLITAGSEDVIHSWAVPSFGLKQDAVPGRLREIWVRVNKQGTYYGQCSEICGSGHAFMPIAVNVVSKEKFKEWLANAKQEHASASSLVSPLTLAHR